MKICQNRKSDQIFIQPIFFGNSEKKSVEPPPPRDFSQSYAPTQYQAPQMRAGDGHGGFVLDETAGERNRRRERETKRKV